MNLEPRTLELSRDNFNSCIETFLRATDAVKDSQNIESLDITANTITFKDDGSPVFITITFKQEVKQDQTTVH